MRIVVLVSGSGTNLQALIDAVDAGTLPVTIAAVGSDQPLSYGLQRARAAGYPTFDVALPLRASAEQRGVWNAALAQRVSELSPDIVVSAGFMKIVSADFLSGIAAPMINIHPALLPSFPGAHAVRDALAAGVKITGCTIHQVDAGVDTGPIIAQAAVVVEDADTEQSLHERIKVHERELLISTLKELAQDRA